MFGPSMHMEAAEIVHSAARFEAEKMGKEDEAVEEIRRMSGYGGDVIVVGGFPASESESESESDLAAAEIMVIWAIQGPTSFAPNTLVAQSSLELRLDACGHSLSILQSPCSLNTPGVTGSVMWDSGVVLGKFLEHSVDSKVLSLEGKKIVELGSGCGLVGCIAALLGGNAVLTDLPDRLRLLKKNIQTNLHRGNTRGSAIVQELVWGDDPDPDLIEPFPDYGSDVIYSEEAVHHLVKTLLQLCSDQTTIFLSGELRNDAVLEYFLETALKDFAIGRVEQTQWHPDYRSHRVVLYVLEKKSKRCLADESSLNQSC
ncbi:tumor-related protein, putative [Arabidopsis thaliana]|uniref:Tumor-related protein, putative n=1 Tax=Arabidopsis thaliana TaxID=3702 RepID=Q9FX27_ARATH|nr:tumor-related protein, putative [Arabidopsis thaliana]